MRKPANLVTLFRIVLSIALLFLPTLSVAFGILYLLCGIWGFIALPFAIIFLWLPEMREVGKRLGILVLLFFLILAHDIVAHVNGHRAWVPFYERVLPFWIPADESDTTLACERLRGRKLEMTLRHLRNRNYGFCVWIPASWMILQRSGRGSV